MKIEIWSDIACPWCAIGKRRFDKALAQFAHRDEVEVVWRSFELDPDAPREQTGDRVDHLAAKYGISRAQAEGMHRHMTETAAADGLEFHFERARDGSTFDAHRLIHLAGQRGIADAVKERLFEAYLGEGQLVADHATLVRLGAEAGLDADDVRHVLASDRFAKEVRAEEREARALGINSVPFFVIDRTYGVSGAQPSETLLEALNTAWAKSHPLEVLTPAGRDAGETCADGSCAI
jgi:predicted DsbA family dithiol-disulfide isomerase